MLKKVFNLDLERVDKKLESFQHLVHYSVLSQYIASYYMKTLHPVFTFCYHLPKIIKKWLTFKQWWSKSTKKIN